MDQIRRALSLVIRKNGKVLDADIENLIDIYAKKKAINIDKAQFQHSVSEALAHYNSHQNSLFICTDSSCLKHACSSPTKDFAESLSRELRCHVELSGCHWQCDQSPVFTLKTGDKSHIFTKIATTHHLKKVKTDIQKLVCSETVVAKRSNVINDESNTYNDIT